MAELSSRAGLPIPEIEDASGEVTVRFRHGQPVLTQPTEAASPAERRALILAVLEETAEGLTLREIRLRLGGALSDWQVRRALEELRDEGMAVPPGRGRWGRWTRGA